MFKACIPPPPLPTQCPSGSSNLPLGLQGTVPFHSICTACDFLIFWQISKITINWEKIIGTVNENWVWCVMYKLNEMVQYLSNIQLTFSQCIMLVPIFFYALWDFCNTRCITKHDYLWPLPKMSCFQNHWVVRQKLGSTKEVLCIDIHGRMLLLKTMWPVPISRFPFLQALLQKVVKMDLNPQFWTRVCTWFA